MVRSGFKLSAGIIFWGIVVVALVFNGASWPLKGFWPLALCAIAFGGLALTALGIIYWMPLRNLALMPNASDAEFLNTLKPGAAIAMLVSATLVWRAIAELNG